MEQVLIPHHELLKKMESGEWTEIQMIGNQVFIDGHAIPRHMTEPQTYNFHNSPIVEIPYMDASGDIYELTEEQKEYILSKDTTRLEELGEEIKVREDTARLDGYLRGRAEAARLAPRGSRKHETLSHNSAGGKTYRKDNMGIEGVEQMAGDGDPGDEQLEKDPAAQPEPTEDAPSERSAPPNPGGTSGEPHRGDETV